MIDEWDERQVCPNGACIGVIGKDGRCNTCGRAASSEGGAYRESPVESSAEDADEAAAPVAKDDASLSSDGAAPDGGEWSDRKLCSDGTCTGVIGSDGRCKVCGKAAA